MPGDKASVSGEKVNAVNAGFFMRLWSNACAGLLAVKSSFFLQKFCDSSK